MGVLKGRKRNDGGAGNSTDNADPGGATAATISRKISTNGNVGAASTAPKEHKKAIGAGNNRIVANAPTATAAAGTLPGESLLYHKSMLAYPLITTTSRVKSTGSGGSSSVDEDEETLVSKLTDPTALKRSTTNLDGDAANFVGASAAEQKVAADDAKPEEHGDDNEEGADDGAEADYDEDQVAPSSRLPPHPTTPASHATDPSETYCYLTVPHSSDATKVSSLGDMDSPCRQALIREFTARFGHGPNSQIIDDGFIKGAAGQPGNDDNLVDFVEIANGCKDNSKLMIGDMNPVALTTLDPIEAEREMNGEFDERKKKNRAMLSYRPSASSSHQHRQEEPGSATSATLSNSRDPMSSSYDTGKSDTSGWVSPNESPGNKADPIIVFEDNTGAKALAESFMINKRSRHFRVRLYYVRQQIRDGVLEVTYVNTKANIADTFTKPLTPALFLPFRDMLVQKPMTNATAALLCRPSAFSRTRFKSTR